VTGRHGTPDFEIKNGAMKKIILILPVVMIGLVILTSWQPGDEANERGKELYNTYCVTCHLDDGKGVPDLNPPLGKTSGVSGNKAKLIRLMLKGTLSNEGDNAKYPNAMAPYDYLTDQEIADVLTYIRKSFGNKAPAVSAAEVKAVRAKTN
jgi:mono/diheme cytochrome c family protein